MSNMKAYIMCSHNGIETDANRSIHLLDKDMNYDLLDLTDKTVVQTVKGSTIVKNASQKKYKVVNLIPPDYKTYMFNCSDNGIKITTIGKIDYKGKEAIVKDIELKDIKFIGKKVKNNHIAVGINTKIIDFIWETKKFNPLGNRMGVSNEENILKMIIGNNIVGTYNLGYYGKVTGVELRRKEQKSKSSFELRLNIKSNETEHNKAQFSIDIQL